MGWSDMMLIIFLCTSTLPLSWLRFRATKKVLLVYYSVFSRTVMFFCFVRDVGHHENNKSAPRSCRVANFGLVFVCLFVISILWCKHSFTLLSNLLPTLMAVSKGSAIDVKANSLQVQNRLCFRFSYYWKEDFELRFNKILRGTK